jgi:hypothetical protein
VSIVSNHDVEHFADDQLSAPGHTALVSHNRDTGVQALSCDECGDRLGRFEPDRWREKRIRDAWQKHIATREVR